jgi:hypothetical protein
VQSEEQEVTSRVSIICPNGHLGFAPLIPESFRRGVAAQPDFIAADSGSNDIGPVPLAMDTCASPRQWQYHDLEEMLLSARRLQVPMIIGSCGDTGTNSRVDLYSQMIREIAAKHKLPAFKLGRFYSEVDKDWLRGLLHKGTEIHGLDGRSSLTQAELDSTDRIVAMAGVAPYLELLKGGCDVILGGRSSDCAVFAAPALFRGCEPQDSYYLGKVLECASFCAEPYGGKETVLGAIDDRGVTVTAMHPEQRCTVASVAGHAMYERANPYDEFFVGGRLDMRECRYTQLDDRTTLVSGQRYISSPEIRVKLEGAGRVGERYVGIASVRDPYTIEHIDDVIAWARNKAVDSLRPGCELHYNIFGRDGVMGDLEPIRKSAHELCIVVQSVAPTAAAAEELCIIGTRQLFYARLPNVRGSAGGVAFILDEVMRASPACHWTMNHTVTVPHEMSLFKTQTERVG